MRYLEENPTNKPRHILQQLHQHEVNPQPDASANRISQIIQQFKRSQIYPEHFTGSVSLSSEILRYDVMPRMLSQDKNKPGDCSIQQWRRFQLRRYVVEYPRDKPRKILQWVRSQKPDPLPQCNLRGIARLVNLIKKPDVLQSSHTYFLKPLPSDVGNVNVGNIFVWDNSISQETDALDWGCRQVLVYHERNPTQTRNDILKEMSRYEPHPWPSCSQDIIKCLIWCHEKLQLQEY